LEEKRSETNLSTVKEYIRLNDTSNNKEVLVDTLRWDLEEPV
jgi:hypothetical protein